MTAPFYQLPEITGTSHSHEKGIQTFLPSKQDPRAQGAGTGLNPACESRLSHFQKFCGSVVKESLKMKSGVGEDLKVPWTARRSNQSILKEINPEYSLEGLMLKLQYFGHLIRRADSLEKTLMLGMIEGMRRKGVKEDEMAGLNGHEFEQTPGDSEGHGVAKSRT